VPFARANIDKLKTISVQHGATDVPVLVLFHNNRPLVYKGVQTVDPVMGYIRKQLAAPAQELHSREEVQAFIASRTHNKHSISTVMVIGFFSDPEGIE
ncbi:unnamed protein product, partial [Symbiodinium microadriaticum]